jgi:hypothetical protein
MYQGTSLWLWVVQGIIWCCVAAFVIAIGLALLAVAAVVGLGWLAWQGWLALRTGATRLCASSGLFRLVARLGLRG